MRACLLATTCRNGKLDAHAVQDHGKVVHSRVNIARTKVNGAALAIARADYWMALKYAK